MQIRIGDRFRCIATKDVFTVISLSLKEGSSISVRTVYKTGGGSNVYNIFDSEELLDPSKFDRLLYSPSKSISGNSHLWDHFNSEEDANYMNMLKNNSVSKTVKECTCTSSDLFNYGCRCGYIKPHNKDSGWNV